MTEKVLGVHTVQIKEVLDSEGDILHYVVTSESFNGTPFRVLSESEVTLERVEQHIELSQQFN
jgi:hypothetical protein